jgi:molybdenum cofactor biosynthesis enzyme MoaA
MFVKKVGQLANMLRVACVKSASFVLFYSIEKPLFLIWQLKNRKKQFELSCYYPFHYLGTQSSGGCYLCCMTWLPYPIGNLKARSIKRIFNSIKAQRMRIAFYKGNFKYCKLNLCNIVNSKNYKPYTREDILSSNLFTDRTKKEILSRKLKITDGPSYIADGISTKCNIQCNFCYGTYMKNKACDNDMTNKVKEYIKNNTERVRMLEFCTEGEPFIHQHVKEVMKSARNNESIGFYFTSNLTHIDDETKSLLKEINIVKLHGSINAAKKETYDKSIKNGNWENVMKNLDYFIDLKEKRNKNMWIQISIVVTNQNYKDLIDFVRFGIGKNLNEIIIYPMVEYDVVKNLQITDTEIPEIEKMLSDKIFDDSRVEVEPFRDFINSLKDKKEKNRVT